MQTKTTIATMTKRKKRKKNNDTDKRKEWTREGKGREFGCVCEGEMERGKRRE